MYAKYPPPSTSSSSSRRINLNIQFSLPLVLIYSVDFHLNSIRGFTTSSPSMLFLFHPHFTQCTCWIYSIYTHPQSLLDCSLAAVNFVGRDTIRRLLLMLLLLIINTKGGTRTVSVTGSSTHCDSDHKNTESDSVLLRLSQPEETF